LILKISEGLGGYFRPYQIRRVAQAEADAELIRAEAQIAITDLQRRALSRFIAEEARKQENIEAIASKAIPALNDGAEPERIDDDWLINFFDKCRTVSNEHMQLLWAKVLAGEANAPGAYSKRTIDLLGSLDSHDAAQFQALCRFVVLTATPQPLVFNASHQIYSSAGVTFETLMHLGAIGLVTVEGATGYLLRTTEQFVTIVYHNRGLRLEFPFPYSNSFPIGHTLFTKVGAELASVCKGDVIPEFFDYLKNQLTPSVFSCVEVAP
jgi:hypothetical protein